MTLDLTTYRKVQAAIAALTGGEAVRRGPDGGWECCADWNATQPEPMDDIGWAAIDWLDTHFPDGAPE